jgi:hypothetical protein
MRFYHKVREVSASQRGCLFPSVSLSKFDLPKLLKEFRLIGTVLIVYYTDCYWANPFLVPRFEVLKAIKTSPVTFCVGHALRFPTYETTEFTTQKTTFDRLQLI